MRRNIHWTKKAETDLDTIVDYISDRNPVYARQLFETVKERAATLSEFPERGRHIPEVKESGPDNYRELILSPYRLLYGLTDKDVFVVGFFDGRRNLDDILTQRIVALEII